MDRITINAVVYKRDPFWVVQCLEYDLVSFAEELADLPRALAWQIQALVDYGHRAGRHPFADFGKAPEKYWKMFEQAQRSPRPLDTGTVSVPEIDACLLLAA